MARRYTSYDAWLVSAYFLHLEFLTFLAFQCKKHSKPAAARNITLTENIDDKPQFS